jgi:hypothetical protein
MQAALARLVTALWRPGTVHQWPASKGLLTVFCGAAAVTVVLGVLGGTRRQIVALSAFAVVTAVVAARGVPVTAAGGALIAWMFDNGFFVNRHGHLWWHGLADGARLGILLGAALSGLLCGALVRRPGHSAAAPPDGGKHRGGDARQPGVVIQLAGRLDRRAGAAGHRGNGQARPSPRTEPGDTYSGIAPENEH